MSSEFQKDLYAKKGKNFSVWDAFIALGIVSLGTGFYYRHKEKKMLTGSGSKNTDRMLAQSRDTESTTHKSLETKENKIPTSVQKNSESTLDKLGL